MNNEYPFLTIGELKKFVLSIDSEYDDNDVVILDENRTWEMWRIDKIHHPSESEDDFGISNVLVLTSAGIDIREESESEDE